MNQPARADAVLFKRFATGPAYNHVDRNVDVAPRSVGICTCLAVVAVHNGLGDFAFQAREADVQPCRRK